MNDVSALFEIFPICQKFLLNTIDISSMPLTKTQILILFALSGGRSLNMSQLSSYLASSKEQATRAVSPLVKEEYVTRFRSDEEQVEEYLRKLLHKEAFDKKGLIYGMGHAVYSISDPRAQIFKAFVKKLALAKGREKDFELYSMIETLAPKVIADERKIYKGVSANVDFYSGFVYSMLDIPLELFTPIFAMARIVGWSAHRLEELTNVDKIIRPAYQSVQEEKEYVEMEDR